MDIERGNMKNILIIEDDASVRKMLTKFLERNGYEVIEAANGNDGIKLYYDHHPDLVITDLIMPEKEGLETIRELKKINPNVQIIAISGGGSNDPAMYLEFASQFGALHTFKKPIKNETLLSTIKKILS